MNPEIEKITESLREELLKLSEGIHINYLRDEDDPILMAFKKAVGELRAEGIDPFPLTKSQKQMLAQAQIATEAETSETK